MKSMTGKQLLELMRPDLEKRLEDQPFYGRIDVHVIFIEGKADRIEYERRDSVKI